MRVGTPRADGPSATLSCALLAPFPDFVAVDLATGALLRAALCAPAAPDLGAAGPLAPVRLRLGPPCSPVDPSRPDGVVLEGAEAGQAAGRRALWRLLGAVAAATDEPVLLGTVGPSIAYADLDGARPSVALVSPDQGRVRIAGEGRLVRFRLHGRDHLLPLTEGARRWVEALQSGELASRRRSRRGTGLDLGLSVLLAVGFAPPERGQVRKVVYGVITRP